MSHRFHWFFRRHAHPVVILMVHGVAIKLIPHQEIVMATILTVGHKLNLAVAFFDQNGNPMLTAPTVDAAPAWSNATPATETIVASADGLSCVGTPVAPGTDTVSLSLTVGGVAFSATLAVEVDAAPQVLTSVGITATVA